MDKDRLIKKVQTVLWWVGFIIFAAGFSAVMFRLDYNLRGIPMYVTFFGTLGVIIVGIVVVAIVRFIARATGKGYTSSRLAAIKRQGVVRPEYEQVQDCTPAEFGVIIDGQCGRSEMVAEIIDLYFKGYVGLEKAGDNTIVPKLLTEGDTDSLNAIDKLLLESIANNTLPDDYSFEEAISQVLKAKGWLIKPKKPQLIRIWKGLSGRMKIFLLSSMALIILPVIIFFVIVLLNAEGSIRVSDVMAYIGSMSVGDIITAYVACVVVGVLLLLFPIPLIAGLTYIFTYNLKDTTIVARNYSPKYKQRYTDVLGLYQYLSVSGMDIMTPDYTTLNFKGIDRLYPYAIAADLDKKIVGMLQLPESV